MIKKSGTIIGLILGLFSIFGAFFIEGGNFRALFLLSPIVIVFGGTFAATIIGFGFDKFKNIWKLLRLSFIPPTYNLDNLTNLIVEMSLKAKHNGFLSLDSDLYKLKYKFPQKLLTYVIDGMDSQSIENLALLEIKSIQERHATNISIFTKMGGYSPTMGILGTVMALIVTLANAGSDPNILIKNISTAFIATLWGVFSANLFWFPIADNLKKCHLEEKNMMLISLEGVLALQKGEIPSVIRARLQSMIPQTTQENALIALS